MSIDILFNDVLLKYDIIKLHILTPMYCFPSTHGYMKTGGDYFELSMWISYEEDTRYLGANWEENTPGDRQLFSLCMALKHKNLITL